MGQKVNPHGLRVGVIKDWDSRWFVKKNQIGDTIVSDYNLRKYLKKTLFAAGIAKIEIERDATRVRVNIHCAKPGLVIGKGGAGVEALKKEVEAFTGDKHLNNEERTGNVSRIAFSIPVVLPTYNVEGAKVEKDYNGEF